MKFEKIISYLFHPVLFGTITTVIFFIFQPTFIEKTFQYNVILVIFFSTYVIPVLFLFLLKIVKNIDTYHLIEVKERKYPVFFFIVLNGLLALRLFMYDSLYLLAIFFLSSTISLIVVFAFLLIKIRISLHTLGLGLFTSFLILMSYHYKIKLLVIISFAIILSSMVLIARLKLKAHSNIEVYLGFFIGLGLEILIYYVNL